MSSWFGLFGCSLAAADLHCDPTLVAGPVAIESIQDMDVSRSRVTWSISQDGEEPAVHFCQFVPETRECVDQRLGGGLAAQRSPSIDGHRVVWEDGRVGPVNIFGLELPQLGVASERVFRNGRFFLTQLIGTPGAGGALSFDVEAIEGFTPEQADLRVFELGRRTQRVFLMGRIPDAAFEEAVWRVRATGGGGLFVDRLLRISADRDAAVNR